jgi:glutathione transport system substrate-binding protein
VPVRHQAAARIPLARVGGLRLPGAHVVGALSVAVSVSALLGPAGVSISPAAASTPRPASPSGYEAEAGQTFLVDAEPLNWNPHSAGQPEVGPTQPGVSTTQAGGGTAADRVGEALADTVGPDDGTLDQILAPVLPSVFQIGPRLGTHLNTAFVESAVRTSTSPQTIVYRINPRAVWSDGMPITYRDFVYNWQAQSGRRTFSDVGGVPFNPLSTDGYRQIASVRESGGDRDLVKVVFKTPDPDWRSLFSLMLPAQEATVVGFNTGFTDPVNDLSAGPFEVQSYTPGVSVTLVRNQRYWGTPANLAQISYRFVPGSSAMLATLAAEDADAAAPPPAVGLEKELARAVSSHPSKALTLSGFGVDEVAGPAWEHLDFNQAEPLLADRAVRRAIMMAVNRRALIAATVGKGDPSVKPLGSLVFVPGQAGYHNDAGVYGTGNTLGARTALVQDGFTYSGARLLQDGRPVTLGITAPAGDPMLAAEEQLLASQLSNIGIHLVVHNSSDLPASLAAGQFDLALVSSQSSPFLSATADRYQTNNGSGAGAENVDHYSSRTTDQLIAQAEATAKPATRIRLFERLDGQLWADAVSLPLYQAPQILVFDRKYLNMVDSPAPSGLAWGITKWGLPASA